MRRLQQYYFYLHDVLGRKVAGVFPTLLIIPEVLLGNDADFSKRCKRAVIRAGRGGRWEYKNCRWYCRRDEELTSKWVRGRYAVEKYVGRVGLEVAVNEKQAC